MPEHAEKSDLFLRHVHERLQELEKRVTALENHSELPASSRTTALVGSKPRVEGKRAEAATVVPTLGKAVLALAGAYLLRAAAESGVAPRRLFLLAAIGYAVAWLMWAARKHRKSRFASMVFGMTAAFVFAPLLWEGTVRFHDLTPEFASALLVGYVALSLGLAWQQRLEGILWIAVVSAVGTALALLIATHEVGSLTVGLLAIAFITEVAAWRGTWTSSRTVSSLGADCAVAILGVVMTSSEGVPSSYRPMGAGEINSLCLILLLIYGGSLAIRGFGMLRIWTLGEVTQTAVAFALGTWVSLRATRGGTATVFGVLFLLLAVACYWGALERFADLEIQRNRRVTENYAAGLTMAGIFLIAGGNLRAMLLSLAAIGALGLFTQTRYLSLGIHGALYLLAASMACHLFGYAGRALAGTMPAWPEWGVWVVIVAGSLSYIMGSRARGEKRSTGVLWLVPASLVAFALSAVIVVGFAAQKIVALSASRLSMVRTVVTCLMALALGYLGSQWNRVELRWVSYGAIGLGALKLLGEDLRFGNAGTLMVSLLFYGMVLILLPRVTRVSKIEI